MKMKSPLMGLGFAALLQFGLATEAKASVTRCDGCNLSGYRIAAENYASGYQDVQIYVVDYAQAQLTLWNVHYDREQRRTFADQVPVPDSADAMFLHILDEKMQGKSEINLQVRPGQNLGPPFSYNPTNGMGSFGAYDVINSGTLRHQLGASLARAIYGGTGSQVLDDMGVTLTSVLLNLTTPVGGPTNIRITIHWTNGTRTVFVIRAGNVSEAEYQPGESRDENGNPIPDTAIVSTTTAGNYSGQWTFNTSDSLERWIQQARDYGIPVTGQSSGSDRLSCTWDGTTLACKRT